MTCLLAWFAASVCAGVLWCRLAQFTDEEQQETDSDDAIHTTAATAAVSTALPD